MKSIDKEVRTWGSGFRGYKNRVTGRLTPVNWELLVKSLESEDRKEQVRELQKHC